MAFDNIGGTYLFPCHASSNQMRIQSNWTEVFGIVGALVAVGVAVFAVYVSIQIDSFSIRIEYTHQITVHLLRYFLR